MLKQKISDFLRQRAASHHISEHYANIFSSLGPGDIAIDCGANIGDITKILVSSGATVYAFEPSAIAFQRLKKRFKSRNNIHIYNQAVWTTNTSLNLYNHEDSLQDPLKFSTGSSLLSDKNNVDQSSATQVDAINLSEFIFNLPNQVTLLKMDIEGAEYDVLNHLIDTGAIQRIKHIVAETHHDKNPHLKDKALDLEKKIEAQQITSIDLNWK